MSEIWLNKDAFVEIETIVKVEEKETKATETIVQETINTNADTNKKIPEKQSRIASL